MCQVPMTALAVPVVSNSRCRQAPQPDVLVVQLVALLQHPVRAPVLPVPMVATLLLAPLGAHSVQKDALLPAQGARQQYVACVLTARPVPPAPMSVSPVGRAHSALGGLLVPPVELAPTPVAAAAPSVRPVLPVSADPSRPPRQAVRPQVELPPQLPGLSPCACQSGRITEHLLLPPPAAAAAQQA